MSKNKEDNNGVDFFQKTIKEHLDATAKQDPLFAKSYTKKGKSLEECCRYIINKVRNSGRMAYERDEIFGMAMHYYDEDKLEVPKENPGVRKIVSPGKAPKRKTKPKGTVKERVQLQLF